MDLKSNRPFVQINEKELAKFKELCEKYGIKYETEEDYIRSAKQLCIFVYYCIPKIDDIHNPTVLMVE